MFEHASRIAILQIVEQLRMRRATGLKTVLVLGARTGGLFRSMRFYQTLQAFAPPAFSTSSQNEQFAHCYHLLTEQDALFSPSESQLLLSNALAQITILEAERNLAALILQGYFDPIITTNADRLLEQALTSAGWQELQDFEVINLVSETDGHVFSRGRQLPCTIIEVFGALTARNYLLQGRYAHMHRNSVMALARLLQRDCLVLGFDEAWDGTLSYLFPAQGDHCWLITEEELDRRSPWHTIGSSRHIRLFVDSEQARYENFVAKLYQDLIAGPTTTSSLSALAQSQTDRRSTPHSVELSSASESLQVNQDKTKPLEVFFSYHQNDAGYLQQLVSHLATMEHQQLIRAWFPQKIEAGQPMTENIRLHLSQSTIILLLVSSDFIASTALYFGEVKQAMELHQAGKATVIPILIRPVEWQTTVFGQLAPLPANKVFVAQWDDYDEAFQNIVQGIRMVVDFYRQSKPS